MKLKKGDWIKLKQMYGFKHIKAKVVDIYKDTIKVWAYIYNRPELRIIFYDDILKKI